MSMPPRPTDELFNMLGWCLSVWSQVEMQMTALFVSISGMPENRAVILFDGIISFEIRLSILDRLMALEAVSEVEREMWNRMSTRMSKAYKQRHELAHFSVHSAGDDFLVQFTSAGQAVQLA